LFEDNAEMAEKIENEIMAVITNKAQDAPAPVMDDEDVIMPTEPIARPHKSIDIDIAVDD